MTVTHVENKVGQKLEPQRPLFLVCGVARPQTVREGLQKQGWEVRRLVALEDHQPIAEADLNGWIQQAKTLGLELVLTGKDVARLNPAWPSSEKVFSIKTQFSSRNALETNRFCEKLAQILQS